VPGCRETPDFELLSLLSPSTIMDQPLSPTTSSYKSPHAPEQLQILPAAIVEYGCQVFKTLLRVKRKVDISPQMDEYFDNRKRIVANAGKKENHAWFNKMRKALAEIDEHTQFIRGIGKL
jgi:hypothetical protein